MAEEGEELTRMYEYLRKEMIALDNDTCSQCGPHLPQSMCIAPFPFYNYKRISTNMSTYAQSHNTHTWSTHSHTFTSVTEARTDLGSIARPFTQDLYPPSPATNSTALATSLACRNPRAWTFASARYWDAVPLPTAMPSHSARPQASFGKPRMNQPCATAVV